MKHICNILFLIATILLLQSCDEPAVKDERKERIIKIAVVLTDDSRDRWDRIINLAQNNIRKATDVYPVIEFYDEDSYDMMTLAYDLARDESIVCVIGCESEANTDVLAYQMSRLKRPKPMFTFNTSQEVIRKYARCGFMWGLSESDITQSEILLSQIASDVINHNVALIACNSTYGQTFIDWFAFQASELGLNPLAIRSYEHIAEIEPIMKELSTLDCPILCVPNSALEAVEMMKFTDYGYFSHKAFSHKTLDLMKRTDIDSEYVAYGVTMVSNPSSGFQDIYEARYGHLPIFGEAQLYDAIMVTSLAYVVSEELGMPLNQAVADLLAGEDHYLGAWTSEGIEMAYEMIVDQHIVPSISGALGELAFTPEKHTIINYSTYAVEYLNDYKFYHTDFVTRGGGVGSSEHSAWIWNKVFDQDFDYKQEDEDIKDYEGTKAVLIATSSGWDNYRHQADVLAYYQYLKQNNFTDDDILLIMADDLASDKKNPYPGQVIRDNLSLENLYTDVTIDYKLDDLTPADLKQILLGRRSEKLPTVLDSTDGHNVLLIWTGHGVPGSLLWDDNRNMITGRYMSELFKEMYLAGKYRKMFGVIEACYSGSVAMECVGVPKLLLMTATNDKETSKAELYSSVWRTYLTNSFNAAVLKTLQERNIHGLSVKDLYTEVFSQTMGSHVTLYNAENFGNVFFNPIGPFFSN